MKIRGLTSANDILVRNNFIQCHWPIFLHPVCMCLLAIILNAREISCTKGECRPFPLRGPQVHPERQPCLSLWQQTRRMEVQSQFVASLRHCPWWKSGKRVRQAQTRRVSLIMTRRDAPRFGIIRGKPYFNPTHRPSTETQKLIKYLYLHFIQRPVCLVEDSTDQFAG